MPATADVLVRLRGVSAGFGGVQAVVDATLAVERGDYVGVVGPSGSGKTTLLKVLAGSLHPQAGTSTRAPDLRVGYVPQVETVNWYFPVTVWETLVMASEPGRPFPWPSRLVRSRAAATLERLGLAGLAGRHIRDLSGGQQQRVFIGRALMNLPNLLLLDEPTSGVDVATRHDVLHLLHDLNHDERIAIVITTHDLNGIAAHMHTLVCLNRSIVAAGPPLEVLTPEVLERTYGAPMDVLSHGGMPVVVEHLEAVTPGTSPLGREHHSHD
jgi:ABC-type Mn2+/Zn2+ transport system ATPase subunit